MRKLLAASFALLISIGVYSQNARSIADSIRLKRRIPALVYAVISSDSILELGGVGYKQFKTKDTISLHNRFHLGSATASITNFIACQLVMNKEILWTSRLLKVIPELAKNCRPEFKSLTLADLLSQRAGLLPVNTKEEFYMLPPLFNKNDSKRKQRFIYARWVLQQKVLRDTSKARMFHFSNSNTAVAVAMIERATGESWEELLEKYVNKKLHIKVKTDWPIRLSENEPMGHVNEVGSQYKPTDRYYWFRVPSAFTGAADANITINDYIKLVQDQLRGLLGKKSALSNNIYHMLHHSFSNYAFGWSNLEVRGNHISECDGTLGTFFSHVEIIKEKNLAVIVLCNDGEIGGRGASINLARKLREMYVIL